VPPAVLCHKVWGSEELLVNRAEPSYCLKLMVVYPGRHSSCHMHPVKHETWVVRRGELLVGETPSLDKYKVYIQGSTIVVPPRQWHWFGSSDGCEFWEVSTFDDPQDTVRNPVLLSGELPKAP